MKELIIIKIMNDFKVICFKLAFLLMTAKSLICFNSRADVGVLSCCRLYHSKHLSSISYIITYNSVKVAALVWSGAKLRQCNHRSAVMKCIIAYQYKLTTHRAASEVLDLDWEIKTAVGLLQLKSTCNCLAL